MLIVNAAHYKLSIEDLSIVFLFNEDDCQRFSAEISRLNSSLAFTCDLYKFQIMTMRGRANAQIPLDTLRYAIEDHNVVTPLFKDNDGNFLYAFDNIDPSADITEWRRRVHDFVIDITHRNIDIVRANIAAKISREGGTVLCHNEKDIASERTILDMLEQSIAESEINYNRYLQQRAPHLTIKRLTTTHYRKSVQRYGVLATIGTEQIPVFFKDIDQKMLYITAMMRYKAGSPLYLSELFNNSRRKHSPSNDKEKVKKWLKKVYDTIVDKDGKNADLWLKKIKNELPQDTDKKDEKNNKDNKDKKEQYRSNPIYQAKSDANRCVSVALKFYPTYRGYCLLKTVADSDNNTFYTFTCPRENISLDESLLELVDAIDFL